MTVLLLGQTGSSELLHDLAEELGRRRHVEEIVLAGTVLLVDTAEHLAQLGVRGRVTEVSAQVMERLLKAVPCLDAMVFGLKEASDLLAEVLQAHVVDGHAQYSKFLGQEVRLFQVIQGWNELAHGEVAGRAKHDHDARSRGFASLFEFVVKFGDGRQRHVPPHSQWALTVKRAANGCQGPRAVEGHVRFTAEYDSRSLRRRPVVLLFPNHSGWQMLRGCIPVLLLAAMRSLKRSRNASVAQAVGGSVNPCGTHDHGSGGNRSSGRSSRSSGRSKRC